VHPAKRAQDEERRIAAGRPEVAAESQHIVLPHRDVAIDGNLVGLGVEVAASVLAIEHRATGYVPALPGELLVVPGIDDDRYLDRTDVEGQDGFEIGEGEGWRVEHDLRAGIHAPGHVAETDVELLPHAVRSRAEIHRCFLQDIQVDPQVVLIATPAVVAIAHVHVAGTERHAQVVVEQVQVAAGAEGVAAVFGIPAEATEDGRRNVAVLVLRFEEIPAAERQAPADLGRSARDGRDHQVIGPLLRKPLERVALEIHVFEVETAVGQRITHLAGGQVEVPALASGEAGGSEQRGRQ